MVQTVEDIIENLNPLDHNHHNLPAPLIVSLTSYPARFSTLPLTLKCLLSQSMHPDRIILWIAHEDKQELTKDILAFKKKGVEIKFCEDLRAFKKIIPTLELEPDTYIVTADDDAFYPPEWLEKLVTCAQENPGEVIAHRVRRIQLGENGFPRSYLDWKAC
jgi:protein O-GlcNAc transferase